MKRVPSLLPCAAVLCVLLAGACRSTPDPEPLPPGSRLGVRELAANLGLTVVTESATRAKLRNAANTVQIFGPPSRWIYVNGRRLEPVEGMSTEAGVLLLPAGVERLIRNALVPVTVPFRSPLASPPTIPVRPSPAPPPAPAPPRPPAPARDLIGRKVVLDAGHGGRDPGATSVLGFREKTVNFAVVRKIRALLEARGARVTLTRPGDSYVSLEERASRSNRVKPLLFVSIHADSSTNRRARGYTIFVARKASMGSLGAATKLDAAMASTGLKSRGIQRADFRVLVKTSTPAVLVEMGFLSNAAEADLLRNDAFQNRVAKALATGIGRALNTLR